MALDFSDLLSNLTVDHGLPEPFEGPVNGFLEAMLFNRLASPLASHHIRVDSVLYVVGHLPHFPCPDLVLVIKLVCRRLGDLLESTLHALELSLEEDNPPLDLLLQTVLASKQLTKLGDEARRSAPITTSM